MSGQRVKTSPKQGPLRATVPVACCTKDGSKWKGLQEGGRRSPGAAPYKGARRSDGAVVNFKETMRRTASLDTIYLRGLFPRDSVFWHRDRSTQTDISTISNSLDSLAAATNSDIVVEDRLARLSVRQQRRRSCSRDANDQSDALWQTKSTRAAPTKSSRSSEEGLNQEIESYILKSGPDDVRIKDPTPEGRKAPVIDLLRDLPSVCPSPLLDACSETDDSPSPVEAEEQQAVSAGSSPHINRFLSRAPPDGCERVLLAKSVPILRPIPLMEAKRPPHHPHVVFTLKPSSHSAFETLQKDCGESPIVPDE